MSSARPHPTSLGSSLDFLRVLWALDHALQKRSKRMAAERGVTGPQRFALRLIDRTPGLDAGALARALHTHPSTLTGVLRRLERDGLVRRGVARGDQRRATLALTSAGRRQVRNTAGTVERSVAAVLGRTPDADVMVAMRFLQSLIAALDPSAPEGRQITRPHRRA